MENKHQKHAYLIMIHEDSEILHNSLKMIDDERNDIYIHVDAKSKDVNIKKIFGSVHKSQLFFSERVKVFFCECVYC